MVATRLPARRRSVGYAWGVALLLALAAGGSFAAERLTMNFNPDWKFIQADPPDAAKPGFDDGDWENVSTPHTFNDTDTFDDWSLPGHRGEQNQWGGRVWYRKTFSLLPAQRGKKVFLEFEAARQVAEIHLNGKLLGISRTGFTPFGLDLTPHLRWDAPNLLAVMCDNRFLKDPLVSGRNRTGNGENGGPSLGQITAMANELIPEEMDQLAADLIPWNNPHWHPAHGGLYRNVFLHVTDPLHISLPLYSFLQTAGPYVYATDISDRAAKVNLELPVQNGRTTGEKIELKAVVRDGEGKPVLTLRQAGSVGAGGQETFVLKGSLDSPRLWEPNYPHLYRVECHLLVGGRVVDNCEVTLGIRTATWHPEAGFFINGNHLKLRGWGQKPTDEWPGLGAAQPDWLHFYTLNLMKQAGANFVRWGHCAGGPASITSGDRLGLVTIQPGVDGEADTRGAAWTVRAAAFRDTIIYYRNNPSILVWEGGNQKVSREHARELRDHMDRYDPHGGRVYAHRRADRTTAEFMEVGIGTEGGREIATLPVVEGEYNREESPRRVWDEFSPPNFGYPEGKGQTYELTAEQFAVNQVSQFVRKLGAPEHSGGANWIFSDSTSGGRVSCEVARTSGEVDGVRLPKEAYFVCQAMFRSDPQVHIIGHWNYPAGTTKTVYVASNGDAVELFVNGKSLGRGRQSDRYLFSFADVTWRAGEVKAVALRKGKVVATQVKRTAGPAVALRLAALSGPGGLRADGADVALFDVEAVDAQGQRCPTFQQQVDFELAGPAVWRGGYNSGRTNSINQTSLDLECGINRVAIRATRRPGLITLLARSAGLKPAEISLTSLAFEADQGLTSQMPRLPEVEFPRRRTIEVTTLHAPPRHQPEARAAGRVGRFTRGFSYSGPTAIVHVERNAQNGKNVYVDRDIPMRELPADLVGADWVQAADGDRFYHAVDLMEIAVAGGTVVSVAHDDRLVRPAWLERLFQPTRQQLKVDGHTKTIYQREVAADESLTLGPNVDDPNPNGGSMYIVFVSSGRTAARESGPSTVRAEKKP